MVNYAQAAIQIRQNKERRERGSRRQHGPPAPAPAPGTQEGGAAPSSSQVARYIYYLLSTIYYLTFNYYPHYLLSYCLVPSCNCRRLICVCDIRR